MPTYDYICEACNYEFESFQSMKEDPLTDCPSCSEPKLRRKIGMGAGIIFKGTGFYETDYKKKSSGNGKSESSTSSESSSTSNSSQSKSSESKAPVKETATSNT
ncbi:MAG: FmdB family zinc ribbon protein [bacterium]